MIKITLILLSLFTISHQTQAAKLFDVKMPNHMFINKHKLFLNGMGIRKYRILFVNVKIYVGGLYLPVKTNKVSEVLNQAGPKFINMHFLRGIGIPKVVRGWKKAFKDSVKDHTQLENRMNRLYKMMEEVDDKIEIRITFFKNKVNINFNGKNKGDILGADFVKALLSTWFINVDDTNLRDGLLGKNAN